MERTIQIGERAVRLKTTASFLLRYRSWFNEDLLTKLMPALFALNQMEGTEEDVQTFLTGDFGLEMVDFYNIVWVLAKTADPAIPAPIDWYDEFETFPILEVLPDALEMIALSIGTTVEIKKNINRKATEKKNTPPPKK